jgi:SSS family solute:Na+ symporter
MVDFLIVAVYMISVLLIGIISGLKVKDFSEYSVSKGSYSTFVMVAAIFATLVGGGSTMGISEKVFATGLVFLLSVMGFVVRDILKATFIIPHFDQFDNCLTVGDIMERFYGRVGKVCVGIAGCLQSSIFLGMQIAAIGHLLDYFLNIPYSVGVLIGMGIVVIYSAFGGIKAVTLTDVIQFSVLIVAIPITFTIGLEMVGGIYGVINSVPTEKLSLWPKSGEQIRFYSLFIVFCLPYMNPAMVQRILMGRNAKQAQAALFISALGRIPYYIMVGLLGLVAFIIEPTLKADMAFPFLVNHILPVGIKGFVISGVMAVIMSTADSFLHVAGILLTHDVIAPLRKKPLSSKQELFVARSITFVIGVVAVIGAMTNSNLIELNILAYAFWLPAISVPLIFAILGFQGSMRGFVTAGIAGIGTYLIWKFFLYESTNIDSLLPSVIVNATVFFSFYFYEKKVLLHRASIGEESIFGQES